MMLDDELLAIRAACEGELRQRPARSWKADSALLIGGTWAWLLSVGAILFLTGNADFHRGPLTLAALLMTSASFGAYAAMAPRSRVMRAAALLLSAVAAFAIVLIRDAQGLLSTAPPWVCSVSHLALSGVPCVLAWQWVRKSYVTKTRALLIGWAMGSVGAAVGELACAQGRLHVALWHLSPWILLGLISLLASRWVSSRSFSD